MDFEDSIAALTAKEAANIELALNDLEDLLFVPLKVDEPEQVTSNIEPDVYKDYMQHAMAGYSAHTEEVTQDEVRLWQMSFSYLQVKGEGMLELDPNYEDPDDEEANILEGVSVHAMPRNQDGPTLGEVRGGAVIGHEDDMPSLRVCGSAIKLSPLIRSSLPDRDDDEEDEGEILYSDGVLEETLHINKRPYQVAADRCEEGEYSSFEPGQCQQDEVVNSLVDIIFPDIVNFALKPLISRVVQAGAEHNVEYSSKIREDECKQEMENEDGDGILFSVSGHYDNEFQRNEDHQSGGRGLVIPDGWD